MGEVVGSKYGSRYTMLLYKCLKFSKLKKLQRGYEILSVYVWGSIWNKLGGRVMVNGVK